MDKWKLLERYQPGNRERLKLNQSELNSLLGVLQSNLEISINRVLADG